MRVEKRRRAGVSGPAQRWGLKGPRTRTRSQAHGSGSHAFSITHQAGVASPPGGRRSAGPGGAVDWGRRARPGGLERRPDWRPRVRQTGDPRGFREPSLIPWAPAVQAPRLQGPSRHRPVARRWGSSRLGVRARKAQRPPGLGGRAWSGPGRGARAPRLAPAPGA